jgi:hypothetical protein
VTVRDWIEQRRPSIHSALAERVLAALGADANVAMESTPDVCLSAAVRCLDALLSSNRFERESAVELLTVDALTTYAFEYASESSPSADEVAALARRGAQLFGQLATQRV